MSKIFFYVIIIEAPTLLERQFYKNKKTKIIILIVEFDLKFCSVHSRIVFNKSKAGNSVGLFVLLIIVKICMYRLYSLLIQASRCYKRAMRLLLTGFSSSDSSPEKVSSTGGGISFLSRRSQSISLKNGSFLTSDLSLTPILWFGSLFNSFYTHEA